MNDLFHAPAALFPGEIFGVYCIEVWVGPRAKLDVLEERKLVHSVGIQIQTFESVVSISLK
jgi:hypothetical protein